MSSIWDSGQVIKEYNSKLESFRSNIERTIKEYRPGTNERTTRTALVNIQNEVMLQNRSFELTVDLIQPRPGDLDQVNEKVRVIREILTEKIHELDRTISRRPVEPG